MGVRWIAIYTDKENLDNPPSSPLATDRQALQKGELSPFIKGRWGGIIMKNLSAAFNCFTHHAGAFGEPTLRTT